MPLRSTSRTGRTRRKVPGGRAPSSNGSSDQLEQIATERDNLLEALRATEALVRRYADYYESAPLAFVTLDRAGVVREINAAGCHLLARERRKVLGSAFWALTDAADRDAVRRHLADCRRKGIARGQWQLIAGDGALVPVEAISRQAAGERECYPTILLDRADLRVATQERAVLLAKAQQAVESARAKDQFLTMIGHELRGPLTPLLAAVATLERTEANNPDVRAVCEILRRSVNVQARLIDDLLDASRIVRGKLRLDHQPCSVHRIVQEALDLFVAEIAAKRLTSTTELSAARQVVDGDPIRLRQVFVNLIKNACKYSEPGGRLQVRSWNHDERLVVEVSDTGVGIPPESLARLFQPFEQLHAPGRGPDAGLGMGLSICKSLVDLHGGRVSATSAGLGRGARFLVELPLMVAATVTAGLPAGVNVLLVEDNADNAEALTMALAHDGFVVEVARTVKEALAVDLEPVDVVVSDLHLPDGDGWGLLPELRRKKAVPAIAISGDGDAIAVEASLRAGFTAHLQKPYEVETLTAAIARVLASRT
ncbi:MAG TPA: ATP-binding protein [Polyangia bacterium]|nr:ATP-binding protein [Polyangia bacterium]